MSLPLRLPLLVCLLASHIDAADIMLNMAYYDDGHCKTTVSKWSVGVPLSFGECVELDGFGKVVLTCKKEGEIKTAPCTPGPSPGPSPPGPSPPGPSPPGPSPACGKEGDSCEADHKSCCDGFNCEHRSGKHTCHSKLQVGDHNSLLQGKCSSMGSTSRMAIWTVAEGSKTPCADTRTGEVTLLQTHYNNTPNCSAGGYDWYETTTETWSIGKCGTKNGVTTTAMCKKNNDLEVMYWKDEKCTVPDHFHEMARGCYPRSLCDSPKGPYPCIGSVINDWYGLCSDATGPPVPPPHPSPGPSPGPGPAPGPHGCANPKCDACCTGACLPCKQCVGIKSGACAACYQIDPTAGTACLYDDGHGCQKCWNPSPPSPPPSPGHGCDNPQCNACCTGACLPCKQCVGVKAGACAACYQIDPTAGTACLYDDGHGCQRCWNPSPPSPGPPTPAGGQCCFGGSCGQYKCATSGTCGTQSGCVSTCGGKWCPRSANTTALLV